MPSIPRSRNGPRLGMSRRASEVVMGKGVLPCPRSRSPSSGHPLPLGASTSDTKTPSPA
ncbi:hypothetical protein RHECNPAF_3500072 [Rhizobium etli CNPAF512]|nr:hypothetical protein RHECNPAF_3500072 [Rhizobium etli CNPAF512]